MSESLTLEQLVSWARDHARTLYAGEVVGHRSCGIAIAETFGRATPAYQSLRRGGLTGCGECGAIKAGELVLGEVFGDPNPTGAATPVLVRAAHRYRELWQASVDRGAASGEDIICNTLTEPFPEFTGSERHRFCTNLATSVAGAVAQTIVECGGEVTVRDLPEH